MAANMEPKNQKEDKKEEKKRSREEGAERARFDDNDVIFMDYVPADAPVFIDD
jgi:hypothetical protein